jgi:hypothetical protein
MHVHTNRGTEMTELIGAYTHKQAEKIVELNNACAHMQI